MQKQKQEQEDSMSAMGYVAEKVQQIVEDMGLTFVLENWSRANLVADRLKKRGGEDCELPFVIFIPPISGVLDVDVMDNVRDVPSVIIGFADRMPLDFKGHEAEEIAERMKGLAVKFIAKANASGFFEPIGGGVRYTVSFDRLDATLLIVSIELTMRPTVGVCLETFE